ncbi:hypothetical protein KC367_g6945 [Hortaea werneckii]|nr:hypothetical protein KC342_g373 [Hortaea werneckii]KAI7108265.1 hypothetical protein KC339_g1738 [Hortaea werneckii]KAI7339207.1 hypothetical protein KC340_g715 [Hortaea werneckii]KAI7356638.1 hypothetical protein KC354_g10315 [Hortaea werneckii]KAI7382934.1 hypothetical protein KC328_g11517 [Hortaea werneckii]
MTFQNLDNPPPAPQPLASDTRSQLDTYTDISKLDATPDKSLAMRQSQKNKQKPADKEVVKTEPDRKRKDDLIAFLPPLEEPGRDFISSLPIGTFHEILSYLILDHDPDRGLKREALKRRGFKDQPHVFLSLSVLSKHLRDNVSTNYRGTFSVRSSRVVPQLITQLPQGRGPQIRKNETPAFGRFAGGQAGLRPRHFFDSLKSVSTRLGAITAVKTNGFRSLSTATFLSSEDNATFRSSDDSSLDDSIEIPGQLNSIATLHFCGLTPSASQDIFARYASSTTDDDLDEYAIGYISGKAYERNASAETDNWQDALSWMGLNENRIAALLDPQFTSTRTTLDAETWAKHIIQTCYDWLRDLDNIVTRGKKRKDESSGSVRPYSPAPSILPTPAVRPSTARASSTGGQTLPVAEVEVALPSSVPDHQIMYKGGATFRLEGIWPNEESNELEFANLYSKPPTDFHPNSPFMLYFTKQYECAYHYATLSANVTQPIPHSILQVAVPTALTSTAISIHGSDWRQLIFESRSPNPRGLISANIQHYTRASLLVGEICGRNDRWIQRHCRDAGEIEPLRLPSGKASQYAFQGNAIASRLNDTCIGKVWITDLGTHSSGLGKTRQYL